MNYFTPERLIRLQDHSDEGRFLAALDDWERAQEDYRQQLNAIPQRLQAIRPRTPAFLKFLTKVSLHDARVLDMYRGGRSRFRITLHPESQSGRLVILTYSLTQPPQIQYNVLPQQLRSEPITWLYDEVALEDGKGTDEQVFHHIILLSDGREVGLYFRDAAIERPVPLVPAISSDDTSP